MSAVLEYPQKHPISAKEYLRMGEAGVFAPEARLELMASVAAANATRQKAGGLGPSLRE